jgi:hypothetical protein
LSITKIPELYDMLEEVAFELSDRSMRGCRMWENFEERILIAT